MRCVGVQCLEDCFNDCSKHRTPTHHKQISSLHFFPFSPFNCCIQLLFHHLKKVLTHKICMLQLQVLQPTVMVNFTLSLPCLLHCHSKKWPIEVPNVKSLRLPPALHEHMKGHQPKHTALKAELLQVHQICFCALFSPENVCAGAVKGLMLSHLWFNGIIFKLEGRAERKIGPILHCGLLEPHYTDIK